MFMAAWLLDDKSTNTHKRCRAMFELVHMQLKVGTIRLLRHTASYHGAEEEHFSKYF